MSLESATYISGLNANNPVHATDSVLEGDDHIRLIKSTMLNTFPNITGAMTASHAELNILEGATVTTAELNKLDGLTASTAELNTLDGITATVSELNKLDGVGTLYHTGNVATLEGDVNHDNLVGFVANEHINHANVDIIAGSGLTGGGVITQDRTLNVGAGDGITVNANDVAVNSTVVRTTDTQTIGGEKTFSSDAIFQGDVEVQDSFVLSGSISPSSLSGGGSSDNYAPSGHVSASVFRLTSAGAHSITGLAGGVDGRRVVIYNIGSNSITLLHENASSTAANRFHAPGGGGGGESIGAGRGLEIIYDGTSSRWRAISRAT